MSRTFLALSNKKLQVKHHRIQFPFRYDFFPIFLLSFFSLSPFFSITRATTQPRGEKLGRKKEKEREGSERGRKSFSFPGDDSSPRVARDNILWANERKSGLVNFQREGERDPKTWNACAISERFSFWLMAGVNGLKREGGRQLFLSLSNKRPPMSKWHTASPYPRTQTHKRTYTPKIGRLPTHTHRGYV